MLRAILSGKAGHVSDEMRTAKSWSQVFRRSEDLLTATVFERLIYLDGPLLWRILVAIFSGHLPPYRVVELKNAQFWPWWDDTLTGGNVEPDVLLTFEVGDPPKRIDLIVEVKHGGQQYADQWLRQWESYLAQRRGEEGVDPAADDIVLLAVGGLSGSAAQRVQIITEQALLLSGGKTQIRAAGADWEVFATALREAEVQDPSAERVIADIVDALAFYGYGHVEVMNTLPTHYGPSDGAGSLRVLHAPL